VRHVGAIAGRELRSYFVSPVAYAVLTLWAVIAGFFFVALVGFYADAQKVQDPSFLQQLNLHDYIVLPFLQTMWVVVLFLVPGLTMGLFASEKTSGTQELLLTSPITIWELVLGKYLAAASMVTLLVALLGAYTGLLFYFGSPGPEIPQTLVAFAGFWLVAITYAAVGTFTSAVTRSQLIAFFLALVVLLMLWMLSAVAPVASMGASDSFSWGPSLMRWLSSDTHFEELTRGLVNTRGLAYFAFMIGTCLVISKAAIESVRWR
jgi:ABC-2 type transport system permease protein